MNTIVVVLFMVFTVNGSTYTVNTAMDGVAFEDMAKCTSSFEALYEANTETSKNIDGLYCVPMTVKEAMNLNKNTPDG